MLLAIDMGNTTVSFAIFGRKKIISRWSLPVAEIRGATRLSKLIALRARRRKIDGVCVASVVPRLERTLRLACRYALGISPRFATPKDAGLELSGYPPQKLGVDRVLAAAAAYKRYGRALIVVDVGSGVTFDAVNSRGRFLGGAIAPGPELMAESLHLMTARLPRARIIKPRQAIGKDTRSCILSGVIFGIAGLIDRLVFEISKEMRARPVVVATGGYAGLIAPFSKRIGRVERDLVLQGAKLAWEGARRLIDNGAGE